MGLLISILYWCMPDKIYLKNIANAILMIFCIICIILLSFGFYWSWICLPAPLILYGVNSYVYRCTTSEEEDEEEEME